MHKDLSGRTAAMEVTGSASVSLRVRFRGLAVLAGCLAFLAVAWSLTPERSGYGTHEQLGVPGCSFLARTGYPCPTCGLTTSMVAAGRGRLALAYRAHPFGVVAVLAVGLAGIGSAVELVTGRACLARLHPRLWWLWAALAAIFGGWVWMLAAGTLSGRWPCH